MALYYAQQFATTKLSVSGGIDSSQTTGIVLQSVSGIDITKPGILCLSWSDPLNTDTYEYVSYTSIDGSNELQGVTRGAEGSTGRAHDNLSDVAWVLSESHINNLNDMFETGGDGFKQIATPSNPSSGRNKLYFKSDDVLYKLTSAGSESAVGGLISTTQYAPEGFLINGKIVPSVDSNNLTVAIKGMDGNDPSASNPVYVRIGDTVHTITSALSVTKNAGTNWCNAGGSELATKEVDYFVYLGYNATDGVVIGFSRIPYGTLYSDFSATTTNEKYCAISTITNAASGDNYVNIGRFAATLSAGAGYTWTVPTFNSSNLIQRPIFTTRILAWIPSLTGFSSIATRNCLYVLNDKLFSFQFFSDGTSNATNFIATTPFTVRSSQNFGGCQDFAINNGGWVTTSCRWAATGGGAQLDFFTNMTTGAWVNSGQKTYRCHGFYFL